MEMTRDMSPRGADSLTPSTLPGSVRRLLPALLLLALLTPAPGADVATLAHPAGVGHDAAALRDAYDLPPGLDGAGTRVAVVTWGPVDRAALDAYADANGLPRGVLQHHGDCSGPALDEWNLDAQMVKAAAPAADVHVYCSPSATFAGLLEALRAAVADDADVVTQSWGACETRVPAATAEAFEAAFAEASARGIAVFAASGDGGARECTRWNPEDQTLVTSWPGSSPLVVAVGGTRLAREDGAWNESAWTLSGGGRSLLFDAPWWQAGDMRASPDVAAVADRATGVEVYSNGRWLAMGGTSAAAPLWAGAWAALVAETGRLGPPGPLLAQAAAAHRDVTLGSNGDYAAAPGHDLVTGWGALQAGALLDALRTLPAAPGGLAAQRGPARGEVALSWNATGGASGYVVLRGDRAGDERPVAEVDAPRFTDAGLPDGSRWSYRVAARSSAGLGAPTLPVAGRTLGPPGAPEALSAWPGVGVVRLAWRAPADDGGLPVEYEVRRDGVAVARVAEASFDDAGCALLRVCAYEVAAVNALGAGPASNEARMLGTAA